MITGLKKQGRGMDANNYGSKAYNIMKLDEAGYRVPKSIFIDGKNLEEVIINNNKRSYQELTNNLNRYDRNRGIREWVCGLDMSAVFEKLVVQIQKELKEPYTVRSSANIEDGKHHSYAGLFHTELHVDRGNLMQAILEVFSSKYSNLIHNTEDIVMGVIVQELIEPVFAGVAFSINPITNDNEMIINYNKGQCDKVVGGEDVKEVVIPKETLELPECDIPLVLLENLRRDIVDIEKLYGYPVDIEWAISDDQIYILQVRPITTYIKKSVIQEDNIFVDSLNNKYLSTLELKEMKKDHKKYMEKHYEIRKNALKAGVKFPKVGYLFYNKKQICEQIFERLVFDATIYKVVTPGKIRTLYKGEVVKYLQQIDGVDDQIARLQQITLTNSCGNASFTEEGYIYIEYIPGGFGGFISGELGFSHYVVDSKGNIVDREMLTYNKIWEFSYEDKKFIPVDVKNRAFHLSDTIIKQIFDMVRKMSDYYKNPRIEWELESQKVYLNDISFENNSICYGDLASHYLSRGEIAGEIRMIHDIDEVKNILKGRSIVAESKYYQALGSDQLKEYLQKMKIEENKKYVIVAASAHPSLSLLMKYSKGFIFERGGALSHLAIILRENKIPAIIQENAMDVYKDKESI